jgi:hypothetical protein
VFSQSSAGGQLLHPSLVYNSTSAVRCGGLDALQVPAGAALAIAALHETSTAMTDSNDETRMANSGIGENTRTRTKWHRRKEWLPLWAGRMCHVVRRDIAFSYSDAKNLNGRLNFDGKGNAPASDTF